MFRKKFNKFRNGIYIYYISLIIYITSTYFQFLHHKTLRDNFQTIIHHYYQKKKITIGKSRKRKILVDLGKSVIDQLEHSQKVKTR